MDCGKNSVARELLEDRLTREPERGHPGRSVFDAPELRNLERYFPVSRRCGQDGRAPKAKFNLHEQVRIERRIRGGTFNCAFWQTNIPDDFAVNDFACWQSNGVAAF